MMNYSNYDCISMFPNANSTATENRFCHKQEDTDFVVQLEHDDSALDLRVASRQPDIFAYSLSTGNRRTFSL